MIFALGSHPICNNIYHKVSSSLCSLNFSQRIILVSYRSHQIELYFVFILIFFPYSSFSFGFINFKRCVHLLVTACKTPHPRAAKSYLPTSWNPSPGCFCCGMEWPQTEICQQSELNDLSGLDLSLLLNLLSELQYVGLCVRFIVKMWRVSYTIFKIIAHYLLIPVLQMVLISRVTAILFLQIGIWTFWMVISEKIIVCYIFIWRPFCDLHITLFLKSSLSGIVKEVLYSLNESGLLSQEGNILSVIAIFETCISFCKQSKMSGMTTCEDQLLLVELVSAIKVLPTDTLIQTVKQVVKQPPQTELTKVSLSNYIFCS